MSSSLWGAVPLGVGEEAEHVFGQLRLRLKRKTEEIWLHPEHDPEAQSTGGGGIVRPVDESISPPPNSWIRWAVPGGDELHLSPVLPDRLIVVSPEQPFFLPLSGRARVFVRIPVFVRVQAVSDAQKVKLGEYPSVVLSDTWWGSFVDGELGYWVGTKARRQMDPSLYEPHLAVCSILLVNGSDQVLSVERFAVRVAYLTLFGRGRAVWTDEVHVRYRGAEGSDIRYTGRLPDDAEALDLLAPPREEAPRGLNARTFGRLVAKVTAL